MELNDRIADAIALAELDPDQEALLEKLLGKDYEVITADDRLAKIAADFVEHAATRQESGKSMLVCVDKITCARMHTLIISLWQKKLDAVRLEIALMATKLLSEKDDETRQKLKDRRTQLLAQATWLECAIIEIIISEAQNEVTDFKKWDFDIIPHRLCHVADRLRRGAPFSSLHRQTDEGAYPDAGYCPNPPYTEDDKQAAAKEVYSFIWNTRATSSYIDAFVV